MRGAGYRAGCQTISGAWLLVLAWLTFGPVTALADASGYRLGTGDVISIQVFGEPDLSMEVKVPVGGTVIYPLLGELKVAGLDARGLESLITHRLKGPYLIDPKVSVTIREYREFYINGEVGRPGGYSYQPGLTLRQAITLAGGLTERASKSKIYVVHENQPEQSRNKVGLDTPVRPGDVITIEQSFF